VCVCASFLERFLSAQQATSGASQFASRASSLLLKNRLRLAADHNCSCEASVSASEQLGRAANKRRAKWGVMSELTRLDSTWLGLALSSLPVCQSQLMMMIGGNRRARQPNEWPARERGEFVFLARRLDQSMFPAHFSALRRATLCSTLCSLSSV